MDNGSLMQFFVVVRTHASAFDLQRVDAEYHLQVLLSRKFLEQCEEFTGPKIKRETFHARYKPSKGTISVIEPFDMPPLLKRGLEKPQEFEKIHMPFTPSGPVVKAIVGIDNGSVSGVRGCYFQYFDKSNILKKGYFAFLRGGMFHDIEEPGIQIADHLTAVISENNLLFRSYTVLSGISCSSCGQIQQPVRRRTNFRLGSARA